MLVLILFLLFVQDGFAQAGEWKSKHKCPKGYLATPFRTRDKTLYIAKRDCAKACNSNVKCRFADLYWTRYGQTCYLRTDQCGDWQNNTHGSYLLYIKGGPTPTPAPVTPTPAPVTPTPAPVTSTPAPVNPAGEWKSKHKCPRGYLATPFRTRDKTLYIAKRDCAKACNDNAKCRFADLYWTRYGQTCYLRTDQCGDWQNNTHTSYLLFIKG